MCPNRNDVRWQHIASISRNVTSLLHQELNSNWKMLGQWFFYCGMILFELLGSFRQIYEMNPFFLFSSISRWDKQFNCMCMFVSNCMVWYGSVFYGFWFLLIKIIHRNIFDMMLFMAWNNYIVLEFVCFAAYAHCNDNLLWEID